MAQSNQKNRGAFFLEESTLYVANDGNGFDRDGVNALCRPNLSAKGDLIIDNVAFAKDKDWLKALNNFQIESYVRDGNRLQTDKKEEDSTIQQYNGRWLLELLQNIDDAIGPKDVEKYIGTKGLGFLSTMEVANYPSIFSDVFNFTFSRDKTKEALSKKGFAAQQLELAPNFQVPWPAEVDKTSSLLKEEGFTTIIRFEIKDGFLEDVTQQLSNLDHHFLLFSQHIESLSIKINEEKTIYSRQIKRILGDEEKNKSQISINIDKPGKKKKREEWIRWQRSWKSTDTKKRSSTMFCLPYENGHCKPHSETPKIYNFYPTEEPSDIKGFLHISFNLTRDRKKLEMWGDQKSWGNENCDQENLKLIDELNHLIEELIDDPGVTPETVIKCFSEINNFDGIKDTKGSPERQIKKTLINTIKEAFFIPRFGGGSTNIRSSILWEHNLLECLEENSEIEKTNLPSKDIVNLFESLREYGCSQIDLENLILLLASNKIKNNSQADRENVMRLIAKYSEKYNVYQFNSERRDSFKRICFLENSEKAIVCLNDGEFILEKFQIPSFITAKRLSKATSKAIKSIILDNEKVNSTIKAWVKEELVENKKDFANKVLMKKIPPLRNEKFWQTHGFELLSFLFQLYVEDRTSRDYIYLPQIEKGKWGRASRGFFSRSWQKTRHLNDWFKEYASHNEYFEIASQSIFRKRLLSQEQFEDKNRRQWNEKLYNFLSDLGVNYLPQPSHANILNSASNDRRFGKHRDVEYEEELESSGLRTFTSDMGFEGLEKFLKRESKNETLLLIKELENKFKSPTARYYKYRGRTAYEPPTFPNFAIFQLYTSKVIKLAKSPIRPSGFYSVKEVYISDKPDKIFPRISRQEAKLLNQFEEFGLSDSLDQPFDVWEKWGNDLPTGYKSLLDESIDLKQLNAQVILFFETFIEQHRHNPVLIYFNRLPILPRDTVFEFFEVNRVLWNDLGFDDDHLSTVLKNFNYGLFCLNKLDGLESTKLRESGLRGVSEVFSIEIIEKRADDKTQASFLTWLKHRWDTFSALNKEFGKKDEVRLFSELEKQIIICEKIEISVIPSENTVNFEPEYIYLRYLQSEVGDFNANNHIFIEFDDNKSNLLSFLCNQYFKWKKSFSLVKHLFHYENTDDDVKNILKQNGLRPDLIQNFMALEKEELYSEREVQLRETSTKKNKEQNDKEAHLLLLNGDLLQDEHKDDNSKNKPKVGIKKRSQKSNSHSVETKRGSDNTQTGTKKISSGRKSFGSRLSGHLRPRHDNEVTVRPYFNDEDESNPENKRIGDMAEEYVFELLRQRNDLDGVQLHGGTNKGFDIEYKKDNDNYFVEVKGLSNDWDDSDVLLSRAQFEKAQEEGDKYSIYIVEYVEDDNRRRVSVLKDPSSYFTKMQIDHGWRNFAEELLLSTKD